MSLEIYTGYFMEELTDWVNANNLGKLLESSDMCGDGYFIKLRLENPEELAESISGLLEDVALLQNPILKTNENLRRNVRSIVFKPCREDIKKSVAAYLENGDGIINLEGFVNFRMNEYMHLINLVLYMAIKKAILK